MAEVAPNKSCVLSASVSEAMICPLFQLRVPGPLRRETSAAPFPHPPGKRPILPGSSLSRVCACEAGDAEGAGQNALTGSFRGDRIRLAREDRAVSSCRRGNRECVTAGPPAGRVRG